MIDTNIFCEDYFLRGSNFRVFFDGLNNLPGTLLIPEVVIDEVVNRFREDLIDCTSRENEARKSLLRMIFEPQELPALNLEITARTTSFRERLEGIVKKYGKVLPYPETPHKKIVERDLARKKPFKRDGSGYRDLLIWETIKSQMLWGTEKIVFLTNNPKDFGDGPVIDPELQPEILNPTRLKLVRSLREFNDIFLIPRLRMIESVNIETITGGSPKVDLTAWLRSNLIDILYFEESLGSLIADFPIGVGRVRPIELVAFHDLRIEDAKQLDSGETLARIYVTAEFEFSIDIDWDEFVEHPEVRSWAGETSEPFSFSTSHHVENLHLLLDLLLKAGSNAIDSYELVSIESSNGSFEFK